MMRGGRLIGALAAIGVLPMDGQVRRVLELSEQCVQAGIEPRVLQRLLRASALSVLDAAEMALGAYDRRRASVPDFDMWARHWRRNHKRAAREWRVWAFAAAVHWRRRDHVRWWMAEDRWRAARARAIETDPARYIQGLLDEAMRPPAPMTHADIVRAFESLSGLSKPGPQLPASGPVFKRAPYPEPRVERVVQGLESMGRAAAGVATVVTKFSRQMATVTAARVVRRPEQREHRRQRARTKARRGW